MRLSLLSLMFLSSSWSCDKMESRDVALVVLFLGIAQLASANHKLASRVEDLEDKFKPPRDV